MRILVKDLQPIIGVTSRPKAPTQSQPGPQCPRRIGEPDLTGCGRPIDAASGDREHWIGP